MRLRHPLFLLFLLLLALCVGASSLLVELGTALLIGFDIAAAAFIAATGLQMNGASPAQLRLLAGRNDAGRALLLLVSTILVLVVLVGVGIQIRRPGESSGPDVLLVAVTLALAWLFGNLVFALHYAHLFYDPAREGGDHGGLSFPGTDKPNFHDFCYFAFVLGMTFQVSDVQIVSPRIRRTATLHGLIAFFFNIGVVALTVNVVASAL